MARDQIRPDYLNDPGVGLLGQQLNSIFPGATGLLGLLNINPDRDLWNALSGNPYGYQQSRMGGNNTMSDILLSESRQAFTQSLSTNQDEQLRQRALTGFYRAMNFGPETAAARAQRQYSPTGLLSSFAICSAGPYLKLWISWTRYSGVQPPQWVGSSLKVVFAN
jgi:hypothetical protein